MEKALGAEDAVKKVKEDFVKADPRHGELWSKEAKKVGNWRKNKVEILDKMQVTLPKY